MINITPGFECSQILLNPVTGSSYWTVLDDRELWSIICYSINTTGRLMSDCCELNKDMQSAMYDMPMYDINSTLL